MRRYVKAKRVAVAGVRDNCHEHHGCEAEPQATADPARCASETTTSSAQRNLKSSAPNMTALVLTSTVRRALEVRHVLMPTRQPIEYRRHTDLYMPL